jgi:hypothetical protein
MSKLTVNAPKVERTITIDVPDFADVNEMIDAFGDEGVKNLAERMMVNDLRNGGRRQLEDGKEEEEIHQWAAEWRPGQKRTGVDKAEKTYNAFKKLDKEAQLELIAKLQQEMEG